MKNQKLRKTVFAALFAAIICVATIVVQIPSPATNGFFNLGDCFVIIAGQLLGVGFGALAAGIGSCLADVFAGYVSFAPGTFVIKAVMGAVVALVYKALAKKNAFAASIVSAIVSEVIMVLGYFGYEGLILKFGLGAVGSIPANIAQGVVAIVLSVAVSAALKKAKLIEKMQ